MAEAGSEKAGRLRNKISKMLKRPSRDKISEMLKRPSRDKISEMLKNPSRDKISEMPKSPSRDKISEMLKNPSRDKISEMPKNPSRDKISEMLKSPSRSSSVALPASKEQSRFYLGPKSLRVVLPASKEHKPSYFVTKSLAKMENEDPIRLQNQSCGIRTEFVKIVGRKIGTIYSSLARLPTFSIGLSSTEGECPPPAPLHESSVDPKDKSPRQYFQMPSLGASVFVGSSGGLDTIACRLFGEPYQVNPSHPDPEYVRSLYKNDRPGGLLNWFRAQPTENFWEFTGDPYYSGAIPYYSGAILSGTELLVDPPVGDPGFTMVGNLGGKNSRASGSRSNRKDCTDDETIREPSDIVEQPGNLVPGVTYNYLGVHWETVEGLLLRFTKGSYSEKPKFVKDEYRDFFSKGDVLQLTRFDDFTILGNRYFSIYLKPVEVIDIVRKNALKTVDVIAAQLVKRAIEKRLRNRQPLLHPIIAIVIFLDHKEILVREHNKEKKENVTKKYNTELLGSSRLKGIPESTISGKKIGEFKDEEEITTLNEEEKIFASEMEDNKRMRMEEDHKVMMLLEEPLPNVPQISMVPLEENELGMKSTSISSNLPSVKVQDVSEASSSIVLIEDDDCKSKDFKVSCHITKWIIYGDLLERTLLCFFNMEEMKYEFYFKDHESMATIIGLGVPYSKVILECGSPHVTVVEIPKEDWDVVWAHSNDIPLSIPKGNVSKQFSNILHYIANIINTDSIVSKANNGGVGGDNGKGKAQGNGDDSKGKGKAHDHDNNGNVGHPNGGSNGPLDDNDEKRKKENDGNDNKKDGRDQDNGKTSNDCKEVQAVVYLHLLPGGVLQDKEKKNELNKVHKEEVDGKEKELGEIYEEEVEKKKKEGEGHKGVEKKKKKNIVASKWHALTRGQNGNAIESQPKKTTTEGVENGDVDESLLKELEKQIHSQMVFTFTCRDEANRPLKTIQAAIHPITFQFPCNNEDNYLKMRRFGWFHKKLQVAFGIVDIQVADLDSKSCKVLDSSEVEEVNLHGISKGNARTTTNAYKGEGGIDYVVKASGAYSRAKALEDKTSKEVQNSWKTNKTLTKGGFSIFEHTDLNSQQLKYSYRPLFPFKEKEFEVIDEDDRLNMYENPICQLQRVSCEGTWQPYSETLEEYKLEASRELGMSRIYNSELETREEKKKKNQPLCFIQKLEKVVYLNHAMSHLTSSKNELYLKEHQSDPFLTQAPNNREPKWPSNNPLVVMKQNMNI